MDQPVPAQSEALDAFLSGGRIRRLQGLERRKFVQDFFAAGRPGPAADELIPDDHPLRIMVMYRLCRQTAVLKGLTAEDETLDATTELAPSPWITPFTPVGMLPSMAAAIRRASGHRLLTIHAEDGGIPLLPPRSHPEQLDRWCRSAGIIAADLGIERTPTGLRGLRGLLDPAMCCKCDVTSGEVLGLEELIHTEMLDMLLDVGERATIKHFREEYGFARKEIIALIRVVKTMALERSAASIEEKRAMQEMRLEDFIGRAKNAMNMDDEMKGVKELAKIQGLTRTEPENQAAEFFDVIKRVSQRQDQQIHSPEQLRLLDGHRAEEVEAIVIEPSLAGAREEDPDDAEALAEYDTENQHQ